MSAIPRAAICIGIQLPLGSLQNSISHSLFSVAAVGARMQARFTERPAQEYPRAHPLGLCGYTVLATTIMINLTWQEALYVESLLVVCFWVTLIFACSVAVGYVAGIGNLAKLLALILMVIVIVLALNELSKLGINFRAPAVCSKQS